MDQDQECGLERAAEQVRAVRRRRRTRCTDRVVLLNHCGAQAASAASSLCGWNIELTILTVCSYCPNAIERVQVSNAESARSRAIASIVPENVPRLDSS